MEFLEKNENNPRLPETTAQTQVGQTELLADQSLLSPKDRQIAEAKRKLSDIVDKHGME